jgi:outer membrane protein assembly factor BamB
VSALDQGQQSAPAGEAGLRDALRQIDALPTPEGADTRTFAMLKSKLRDMLLARHASKSASTAPSTNRSKVTDLSAMADVGRAHFYWTYGNEGDYNQNGWVNISDLSILGIHYGKNKASADWAAARAADGNRDGQINLGDLASIGMGFSNTVTHYWLEYSATTGPSAVWTQAAEVQFFHSAIPAGGLRRFDYLLDAPVSGYYRVVPCDMSLTGIPSEPAAWGADKPGDWRMFGRDRQHMRRSPFTGPATNALKWSYPTAGVVRSSPAISADGTVYVGSNDGKLYAINPDGSPKWSYTTGGIIWASSPAIGSDGTVYIGSDKLYALKPDGSLKWSCTTGGAVHSSPAIGADGTVYARSEDNSINALNPDGSVKWSHVITGGGGSEVDSSPAIGADGTIYVGNIKLSAINSDGTIKWEFTAGGDLCIFTSSPAIGADGTVYVGSWDDKFYAINPDGSLKWAYAMGAPVDSSPAISVDGTIYIGNDLGIGNLGAKLYAFNPDGSLKWTYTTGDGVVSSPALDADGTVYVGSTDNSLYAINANGSLKWSYVTGDMIDTSSPAIGADGTVYVGSDDKNLYAIGLGGG